MSVERTRRVLELVDGALAIDVDDRMAWLRDACDGDAALLAEATALIELAPAAEHFLLVGNGKGATFRGAGDRTPPIERPAVDFAPGSQLGDFHIEEQIGAGGMGVVYRAQQSSLNRPVALKVLPAYLRHSPSANTRFRREIEAAARLHHTNIVSVFATGEEEGTLYYAMELVDGPPLSRVLEYLRTHPIAELQSTLPHSANEEVDLQRSASTPAWAVRSLTGANRAVEENTEVAAPNMSGNSHGDYFDRIAAALADVADALHYAHQHDVIHRDVKPSNLLLSSDGQLHISDFGLARVMQEPGLTRTGEVLGTPYYMAPEQISPDASAVDGRADVYGLGATLYELLTLQPPFIGDTREKIIAQIVNSEPVPPRRLNRRAPHDLQTICIKAIERDPTERYQFAAELAADLRAYVNRFTISAKRAGPFARTMKWARRHPGLSSALALAGVFALVAAFFAFSAHRSRSLWTEAQQEQLFERALMAALEGKSSKVQIAVDEARQLGAPPGKLRLLEGQVDLMTARYTHAYENFEYAAAELPDDVAAQSLLALSCMHRLLYDQGETIYRRLQQLQPRTLEDYLHRARVEAYFDADRAAETLDQAVERNRASLVARLIRGDVQVGRAVDTADVDVAEAALADFRIAEQLLGDAPVVSRGHMQALLAAATAYEAHGQPTKRTEVLRQAAEVAKQLAQLDGYRARRTLAFYYDYVGDVEQAVSVWREFQNRQVLFLVLTLVREGRYDEAAQACNQVQSGPTVDRTVNFFRALIEAFQTDSPSTVRARFPTVGKVRLDPIHELLTVYTISCLVDSPEVRRRHCQRLVAEQQMPTFRNGWYRRLTDYVCGNQTAEQLLSAAAASRKNLCEAHYYVGAAELAAGNRAAALEHFDASGKTRVFNYFENYLSRALLAQLRRDPDWPKWIAN